MDFDPRRLVLIDKTMASIEIACFYGRALKGQRCRAAVPHGHWKTTTFTAGLRIDSMVAQIVFNGTINGNAFLAYIC
jgi:hypothetical protein